MQRISHQVLSNSVKYRFRFGILGAFSEAELKANLSWRLGQFGPTIETVSESDPG